MTAPMPGSFIRPAGRGYSYCMEIVRVIAEDAEGPEQWQCKRWGLDENKQPIKDGHSDMHYLNNLKTVAPGVWKDEWNQPTPRWSCCPLYYRAIELSDPLYFRCNSRQQLGLFV
ncbi:MAG: hypothetical protein M0Q15_16160 [Nevskia sp.]|jgi:hypothetical protein|nr:hypothetical protein [Nevskia sp.]